MAGGVVVGKLGVTLGLFSKEDKLGSLLDVEELPTTTTGTEDVAGGGDSKGVLDDIGGGGLIVEDWGGTIELV